MYALVGDHLLSAWDRGFHESDLARPLTLLSVSSPEWSRESLTSLSLVQRDLELWRLRRMTFGEWLRATLLCAGCSAHIEFTLALSSVIEPLERLQLTSSIERQMQEWSVAVRPMTTVDLETALGASDPELAKQELLERCVSITSSSQLTVHWQQAPESVRTLALEAFEEIHEGAELTCAAICPQCGHREMADLDIGRFLWFEVHNAAKRLLREVHELASVYGWSERDILAMSSQRRQSYLTMVRA